LEQIAESIELVISRCENVNEANEFLLTPDSMMKFDSCVMRRQAIGEQIGKILKEDNCPFDKYSEIPWVAAYDMRNFISHEYANIDEAIVLMLLKKNCLECKKPSRRYCLNIDSSFVSHL
jgi:uncharacterized protein with HEPN domain